MDERPEGHTLIIFVSALKHGGLSFGHYIATWFGNEILTLYLKGAIIYRTKTPFYERVRIVLSLFWHYLPRIFSVCKKCTEDVTKHESSKEDAVVRPSIS